jgi:hypothetical protein
MWTDREITMLCMLGALGIAFVTGTAVYTAWR